MAIPEGGTVMFFTYNARRSFLEKLRNADSGAGGGSASSGNTGASGSSSDATGTGADNGSGTGSAGEADGESSEDKGEDSPKLIHGMAPEVWNALSKSAQEAIKDVGKFRRQVRELEGKVQAYEGKELTEAQKLEAERKALEAEKAAVIAERRAVNTREAFITAGKTAGAKYPELLHAVAPLVADIELDDQDRPKNVDALIRALKGKYPDLFNTTNVNGGSGNGTKPVTDPKAFGLTRIQAAYANSSEKK